VLVTWLMPIFSNKFVVQNLCWLQAHSVKHLGARSTHTEESPAGAKPTLWKARVAPSIYSRDALQAEV
jgi:hypothetical protein